MDKDTYLVLRVSGATPEALGTLGDPVWREAQPQAKGLEPLEYQVDAQALDQQEYRDARRDPQIAVIARPMPLKLIEPVAAPHGAAGKGEHIHGATWGVFVTGALQSPYVGHGVTVAVLDTGIDATHEAFRGVELVQRDFTGAGDGDTNGHGTHVAGTIFGQTVGGVRYGVAPGIRRALIGKVIGAGASTKELIEAITWATDNGAQIINMSLGYDFPGLVKWWIEQRALPVDLATSQALAQYRDNMRLFDRLVGLLRARAAYNSSALIVAAAGNESKRDQKKPYAIDVALPAATDGVVAVAALQSAGSPHDALALAPFSNMGAALAAPGVDVYSAKAGGGYTTMNGTSMASPHVAGVAALWAEWQIKRTGAVNIDALAARLIGKARNERLSLAQSNDVGEGLVAAPEEA